MAVAFDKLKPGMILLDIHNYRVGNTAIRQLGCWNVFVVSVDAVKRTAMCRWNGNPPRLYVERDFKSLRLRPSKKYLDQQNRKSRP